MPRFMRGEGRGWVTAEYGMLPRSTGTRMGREAARGKQGGRTVEIQRLIGRSLRAALDLDLLGENTITIDCDVIQADGGTRTASITGACVALVDAIRYMLAEEMIETVIEYTCVSGSAVIIMLLPGTPSVFQVEICTALATKLRWVSCAPFGTPVVPPVYMRTAVSSPSIETGVGFPAPVFK